MPDERHGEYMDQNTDNTHVNEPEKKDETAAGIPQCSKSADPSARQTMTDGSSAQKKTTAESALPQQDPASHADAQKELAADAFTEQNPDSDRSSASPEKEKFSAGRRKKTPYHSSPKQKKRARKLLIGLCAAFVLLLGINFLSNMNLSSLFPNWFPAETEDQSPNKTILFYPIDYEKDIFQDQEYLELNRYIRYTEGAQSTLITDGNYAQYGEGMVLLSSYFDAIIRGDCKTYNSFFTEKYFEDREKKERFTMQELYDIEIQFLSKETLNEGTDQQTTRLTYRISYKIHKNNSTFRLDIDSDAAVQEAYEILINDKTDVARINAIIRYKLS